MRDALFFAHHDLNDHVAVSRKPEPSVEEMHRYKLGHELRCNHTIALQSSATQGLHSYKLVHQPHDQHRYKFVHQRGPASASPGGGMTHCMQRQK